MLVLLLLGMWISVIVFIIVYFVVLKFLENIECVVLQCQELSNDGVREVECSMGLNDIFVYVYEWVISIISKFFYCWIDLEIG